MTSHKVQWIPFDQRSNRCNAELIVTYAIDKGVRRRCKARACVEFDGAPLCKKHASVAALNAMAGDSPVIPALPDLPELAARERLSAEIQNEPTTGAPK